MQSAALFPLTRLLAVPNGQLYEHLALQLIAGLSGRVCRNRFADTGRRRADAATSVGPSLMLAGWATISVALSFGSPGLGFIVVAIPGPIQTAFYRYLPASWLLCLCILAGLALDDVCRGGSRLRSLVGGVAVLIMLTMALRGLDMPAEGLFRDEFARHTTWAAAGFGLLLAGLIVMPTLPAAARGGAMAVVLAAESMTWFVLPTFVYPRHARLDLGVVRFLDANLGLQRFATLEPISPNYGSTSASHR